MDPIEVQKEIMRRLLLSDTYSESWSATKKNAFTMLTVMQSSGYQDQAIEMLNENNIYGLIPSSQVSKIYPVNHPNRVCWNFENDDVNK